MLRRSYIYDPERKARVEAHTARVQASQDYQAEKQQLRKRVRPKRDLVKLWLAKIDRIDAMGSNLGHAFQRQFRRTKWSTNDS